MLVLGLHFCSMDHHSHRVLDVLLREVLWVGESPNGGCGVVVAAFTDHPPRTGRTEVDDAEEWDDPDPLEDEGEAPGEVGRDDEGGLDDTAGKEDTCRSAGLQMTRDTRTYAPAHIDISSEVTTKLDRADFCGVPHSQSLEDAPRDTAEDLAGNEHPERVAKNEEEDGEGEHYCARSHNYLRAVPIRRPTVDLSSAKP